MSLDEALKRLPADNSQIFVLIKVSVSLVIYAFFIGILGFICILPFPF